MTGSEPVPHHTARSPVHPHTDVRMAVTDASFDRAYGALLGAFVGDAAGVPVEFSSAPSEAQVQDALSMCGGGPHSAGKGQISDDSELALAAAWAILEANPGGADQDPAAAEGHQARRDELALAAAAARYCAWLRSDPFDCGHTCANAFRSGQHC